MNMVNVYRRRLREKEIAAAFDLVHRSWSVSAGDVPWSTPAIYVHCWEQDEQGRREEEDSFIGKFKIDVTLSDP